MPRLYFGPPLSSCRALWLLLLWTASCPTAMAVPIAEPLPSETWSPRRDRPSGSWPRLLEPASLPDPNANDWPVPPTESGQPLLVSPENLTVWQWQLLPQGLIYRTYLASDKEPRFRGFWAKEKNDGWIWDTTLGGRVGIIRYGSTGDSRPEGFQIDIEGAGIPRLDLEDHSDLIASDFRFGIPVTFGNEFHQVKIAYYHISSHLGDEFLIKHPGFHRLNYSRDTLVYGHSFYPNPWLRFYAEAGWAPRPNIAEPWEFQFGIDYSPAFKTGIHGAPFAAVNGSLRQEVDFGGNFVFQTGWAWRGSPASGLFRLGMEYYNGKSDQFSFYNESEEKIGFGIWYDF